MKKNITKFLSCFFAFALFGAMQMNAQEIEVFWGNEPGQGDFSNGLEGWTTVNIAPDGRDEIVWQAAPNGTPLSYPYFGSNYIFSSAPTASNGVATFSFIRYWMADNFENAPFSAELISPIIDCTGKEYVRLEYYQAYNRLNNFSSVGFSIDGGQTWRLVQAPWNGVVNTTVDDGRVRLNVPEFANEKECRIKFVANGDAYYWTIDDVSLRAGKETDIRINDDWYSSAPNPQVPAELVTGIPFYLDVQNAGNFQADSVTVKVSVLNGEEVLHTQTMDYGTMGAGDTIQNRNFPETFTPPSEEGVYTIRYEVNASNENSETSNNIAESTLHVGGKIVSKNPRDARVRGIGIQNDDYGNNFSYGNFYAFPTDKWKNGNSIVLDRAGLGVATRDTNALGSVIVNAYRWKDAGDTPDNIPNFAELEDKIVASGKVQLDTSNMNRRISVELFDYDDSEAKYVYEAGDDHGIFLVVHSSNINQGEAFAYIGGQYKANNTSATASALAQMGVKDYMCYGGTRQSAYKDGEDNAIVYEAWPYAWYIPLLLSENTSVELDTDIKFSLYPVPASNYINIDLPNAIQKEGTVIVKVYDIAGNKVISRQYTAESTVRVNTAKLAAGTYTMKLESKTGFNTKTFVVAK